MHIFARVLVFTMILLWGGGYQVALHARTQNQVSLLSFETGYTIMKVRTGQSQGENRIIAASYEGSLLVIDNVGTVLWTNPLSGFMVHDLWCEDVNGDQVDDVLVANADGYLYCLDGEQGTELWRFTPTEGVHKTPMYAVCTVRIARDGRRPTTAPYVVCGGFDKNMYYLSATGQRVKTIASSTYSQDRPWGDDKWVGYGHTVNFLRPIPQADGSDHLALAGTMSHMQSPGSLYRFLPLEEKPYSKKKISGIKTCGDMRVIDTDGDGKHEFLFGSSGLTDQYMVRFDPAQGDMPRFYLSGIGTTGYRVTQSELIHDGGKALYMALCGTHIKLIPLNLSTSGVKTYASDYAYNDMWKDPTTGKIILASSQSGGSCIHVLDPRVSGWQSSFENLRPAGKIETIRTNTSILSSDLNSFVKPSWERDPIPVYLPDSSHALAKTIKSRHTSPVFVEGYWHKGHIQKTDWRYGGDYYVASKKYRDRRDTRNKYDLTQQQVINQIVPEYNGEKAVEFWAGHGNDPLYYSPDTLQTILERANGKVSLLTWPELGDTSDDFKWVLDNIFYPLAETGLKHNAKLVFKSKDVFWSGDVYEPLWNRLLSGELADAFYSSMEETTDKTQDLSIVGRMGLWAAGSMNQWGMRTSRDNPSFDRSRQHSYQRLPNHFLRTTVYNLACGATYGGLSYIDDNYFSVLWPLVAKGALFVPKREEIVSFSPVHLSMIQPDARYLNEAKNNKWTVFYDEKKENENPMVFSHMNGSWPGAELSPWDFSRYASGLQDRRQNFIPPYPNGIVLITPPQQGIYADPQAPRGQLTDHLHPLYNDIMTEFITDGRDYISSDGQLRFNADEYYLNIADAIENAASKLPLTVSGDVGWVCAQTAPNHLRLTLVDNGYLNPQARIATVTFHTVTPVHVEDVIDKTAYKVNQATVDIDVPLGLFRFIDIELDSPLGQESSPKPRR